MNFRGVVCASSHGMASDCRPHGLSAKLCSLLETFPRWYTFLASPIIISLHCTFICIFSALLTAFSGVHSLCLLQNSAWRHRWPRNSCLLHSPKSNAMWMIPNSAASWSSSWALLHLASGYPWLWRLGCLCIVNWIPESSLPLSRLLLF